MGGERVGVRPVGQVAGAHERDVALAGGDAVARSRSPPARRRPVIASRRATPRRGSRVRRRARRAATAGDLRGVPLSGPKSPRSVRADPPCQRSSGRRSCGRARRCERRCAWCPSPPRSCSQDRRRWAVPRAGPRWRGCPAACGRRSPRRSGGLEQRHPREAITREAEHATRAHQSGEVAHLAGSLAARSRESAGASSAVGELTRSRQVGADPRHAVAQLALRALRWRRPVPTQPTSSGTIVSRNDSESAAWTRSASGQPPSSCTRTSASTSRVSLPRRLARPAPWPRCRRSGPGASGCTRACPSRGRSPRGRAGSGYARSMSCVTAAMRVASEAPGSSFEQPVDRSLEVAGVRMDLRDPRMRALQHARPLSEPPRRRPVSRRPDRSSRRHRPRLKHVDLAFLDRPLDVLRAAEPPLEVVADPGELAQLLSPSSARTPSAGPAVLPGTAVRGGDDRERLASRPARA